MSKDQYISQKHREHAQAQQRVARTYPKEKSRTPVSCLFGAVALLAVALLAVQHKGSSEDYEKDAANQRARAREQIDPLWKGYKATRPKPVVASKSGCLPLVLFAAALLTYLMQA